MNFNEDKGFRKEWKREGEYENPSTVSPKVQLKR